MDSFHWPLGLRKRGRIIHALMMKEALGKHGHDTLGFFWMMGEPLFLLCGIMFLWSFAHITHGTEIDVIPFALSAYSYLTLWRHIAGGSVKIIQRSRTLMFFRDILMLDVMLAKAALETLSLMTTFFVVYLPFLLLHLCPLIYDPLPLVFGFVFTGWFAFAFGLVLATFSEINEAFKNLIGAIMYITLPVTGAFTMQDWLPAPAQRFFSWSPLVNCVEMIRGGLFSPDVVTTHYDVPYLIWCCSVLSCAGILAFSYAERNGEV